MDQKTIIAIIIFFVLVVGGMFGYAFMKQSELAEQEMSAVEETQPEPEVAYASITRIDGKHYFIDGVHTIVGEVPMPTPCDLLEAGARVAESYPEQVTLEFSVINNTDNCIQMITPQRFKVSFAASEEAKISPKAQFAGREVELNLVPAAPGETPDEFELFIKG